MSRFRIPVCAGAATLIVALVGCTPSGVPDTPDGTVQAVCKSLSENQPGVAWDALPPSYQSDINGLVREFAAKMDPQVYDKGFAVLGKIVEVLKTKRDFILGSPMLQMAAINVEEAKKNWDSFVNILEIPLNSELKTVEGLKSLDVGAYLAGTGAKLMGEIVAASKIAPATAGEKSVAETLASLADVKVEITSTEGENAKLKVTIPGQDPEELELTKVDGKWLPRDLVDNWDKTIAEAKKGLAEINPVENKVQVLGTLGLVEGAVDALLSAKTQEEFNQQLGGLVQGAMSMGGGASPPGAPDGF